jgi:hypothetical protein
MNRDPIWSRYGQRDGYRMFSRSTSNDKPASRGHEGIRGRSIPQFSEALRSSRPHAVSCDSNCAVASNTLSNRIYRKCNGGAISTRIVTYQRRRSICVLTTWNAIAFRNDRNIFATFAARYIRDGNAPATISSNAPFAPEDDVTKRHGNFYASARARGGAAGYRDGRGRSGGASHRCHVRNRDRAGHLYLPSRSTCLENDWRLVSTSDEE